MTHKKNCKAIILPTCIVFLIQVLVVFIWTQCSRTPLCWIYPTPPWDLAVFDVVGKGMVEGLLPYRDLFDHKGPYVYIIWGIKSFFSPLGLQGMAPLYSLIMGVALLYFYKTFTLYCSQLSSLLLSLTIPFLTAAQGGGAAEFALPGLAVMMYFYLKYWKDPKSKIPWVLLGGCVSYVLLLKFNLTAFFAPLLLACLWNELRAGGHRAFFRGMIQLCVGAMIPLIPVVIYFALHKNGLLSAWQSYFAFCFDYAAQESPDSPQLLKNPLGILANFAYPFRYYIHFFLAVSAGLFALSGGLVALSLKKLRNKLFPQGALMPITALWASLFLLFVGSFSGAFSWYHYQIPFMPFVSLTLLSVCFILKSFFHARTIRILLILLITSLLLKCLYELPWSQADNSWNKSELAQFISEHQEDSLLIQTSPSNDKTWVSGVQLHFAHLYLMNRHSPVVRKFYSPPIRDFGTDDEIATALEERRSAYCVYLLSNPENPFAPRIEEALKRNYQHIKTIPYSGYDALIYRRIHEDIKSAN